MFGLELLREIGRTLYGDGDPTAVMYQGQTYRVTQQGPEYVLEVRLPFVEQGEVQATHAVDRLVVQVHGQRRSYLLPKFLAYYTLTRSRVENGWMRAHFAEPA